MQLPSCKAEVCLLAISAALLFSAAGVYYTKVLNPADNERHLVDWKGMWGDHKPKRKESRKPFVEAIVNPPVSIQYVQLPPEMPAKLRTAPCLSHDVEWLLQLATSATRSKALPRSKLWACRTLYEHYGEVPPGWKEEMMLQQDFLSSEYRLYLRDLARTELLDSNAMCTRFFGKGEGEHGTKYLGAGSYGLAFSTTLSAQLAALPPPPQPPITLPEKLHRKLNGEGTNKLSTQERAVLKIAGLDKAAHVKSATLAAGLDVSVEGYYQEAMSHIVEAGMPHVAIGYGVWICDTFEKIPGPLNLLYPGLNCEKQRADNTNSTLAKLRKQGKEKHPSKSERVASCTVLKDEIKSGVMSPNMQVLMIEQVHLGLKQTMQLMHKHVHRSYLAVAQKAFFFQFVFTVGSLQKAFGPTYKHNDLMLGNIRSTFPQWLGDGVNDDGYAAGGRMAAPMQEDPADPEIQRPLSYLKYRYDGVEYTLPNFGFNLRLADYDFSQSTQSNRTRNPKVEWIKKDRKCGQSIDEPVWASLCRTVNSVDPVPATYTSGSLTNQFVGTVGETLVQRAKATLAKLETMSTLNDDSSFVCQKTSFTCRLWRAHGCHNAAEDYGLSSKQVSELHTNCKRSCTNVDLHVLKITVDGPPVESAPLPSHEKLEDDSNYRDPTGFDCRDWEGYKCEEYARDTNHFTPTQIAALLKSCPATCPSPLKDEDHVVRNGDHVLVRFGGSGSAMFDGQIFRARVDSTSTSTRATQFTVEVTATIARALAKLSSSAAQTMIDALGKSQVCFLQRDFWVQRGPLLKLRVRKERDAVQEYELVLEQYGKRNGPREESVIRLIDPGDGLHRDYQLKRAIGIPLVAARGGKSIMTWRVLAYNNTADTYPADATSITDLQEKVKVQKTGTGGKQAEHWVTMVKDPLPWRGLLDGYGYITRVPSMAPFQHFYQEGIVPVGNRRLDVHFVLNALLHHPNPYEEYFKGEVWQWITKLLEGCDQCEKRMSKSVFESRMSSGMQYRYCELNTVPGLSTDSEAILGFPLPEDILASSFFADFRGEGSWRKAPGARQVLRTIDVDKVPTDLGAIHNGALLVDDPQRVAPPFPSAVRSNGPATGEGAYVVEGGAAT